MFFQYARLNQAADAVLREETYPDPVDPGSVEQCDDGGPIVRELRTDDQVFPVWQRVIGHTYTILVDHVQKSWTLEDWPLAVMQLRALDALEVEFEFNRAAGFDHNGTMFPLNRQAAERMEVISRLSLPLQGVRVSRLDHGLREFPSEVEVEAWLTAGNNALATLFSVHDQHAANIMATTTPEAAATYDYTTGWPNRPQGAPPVDAET